MGVVNGRILRRLTWAIKFAKDDVVVAAAMRAVGTFGQKARTKDIVDAISFVSQAAAAAQAFVSRDEGSVAALTRPP